MGGRRGKEEGGGERGKWEIGGGRRVGEEKEGSGKKGGGREENGRGTSRGVGGMGRGGGVAQLFIGSRFLFRCALLCGAFSVRCVLCFRVYRLEFQKGVFSVEDDVYFALFIYIISKSISKSKCFPVIFNLFSLSCCLFLHISTSVLVKGVSIVINQQSPLI